NCAVGHDNVDVVAAEMRRVTVTNTPDVLTDATADHAWALILACARHVVPGTRLVKSGSWTGWHPELLLGIELRGRILGLYGAGHGVVATHRQRHARDAPPDGDHRGRERAGGPQGRPAVDPCFRLGSETAFPATSCPPGAQVLLDRGPPDRP